MPDTAEEYLVTQLKNAHALEQMSLRMTAAASKAAEDDQLRKIFDTHHQQTETHERLIRERLEAHGEGPSALKDIAARVAAVGKGAAAVVPDDKPGRIVRDGYIQEQTEIASYELLRRIADRTGDRETVRAAERILEDEREAAAKLAHNWERAAELSLQAAVGGR
jgi:ferritin-like metal-binding protein YciE